MFKLRQCVYLALILAVACNGINFIISGLSFTLGRLSAFFILISLTIKITSSGRFRYGGPAGLALALWLLWSLLVNLLTTHRSEYLIHWGGIAAATLWFWWIVCARPAWDKLEDALAVALIFFGSVALFTYMACYIYPNYHLWNVLVPATHGLPRIKLWMHEPNIFGAVMAAGTCMLFGQWSEGVIKIRLGIILGFIGVLLSFSKGPWLDLAAGYAAYIVFIGSKKRVALVVCFCIATTVVIFAAISLYVFISSDSLSSHVLESLVRGRNIWVRAEILKYALNGIVASPVIGNGTFSFSGSWPALAKLIGLSNGNNLWIWNGPVLVLHDYGLVGLILIGWIWFCILFKGISENNKKKNLYGCVPTVRRGAAVMSACVAILVQDQSTTVFSLSLYWVILGLGALVPYWQATSNDLINHKSFYKTGRGLHYCH